MLWLVEVELEIVKWPKIMSNQYDMSVFNQMKRELEIILEPKSDIEKKCFKLTEIAINF